MKTDKAEIIQLLRQLVATPSYSKEEDQTAALLGAFLEQKGIPVNRDMNNVWVINRYADPLKPTILLNSHHDTVKPNAKYTRDPFLPSLEDGKLFGLGSNDAGGALVSLLACFLHFYDMPALNFNVVFAATAEEEISGHDGIERLLPVLGPVSFGIVGEPTKMDVAVSEKGLMVLDCETHGKAGHAAREEGINAIYKALPDIEWFRSFRFANVSDTLGPVKMTVSMIEAGSQHNMIPDTCRFTVDVRTTDAYSNQEILDIIRTEVKCRVEPRSVRLNPSSVPSDHAMVKAAVATGAALYGSPTTSDQALMPFYTFKMGPGDSARSHTADEFIYVKEIEDGIDRYIQMLTLYNNLK
ncbi:MAG: M20 family metallo-hydrolase [Bacteroidetes bacterium]|nr:M20 family metallo-hydrolase [Bacteroidota bacterium]